MLLLLLTLHIRLWILYFLIDIYITGWIIISLCDGDWFCSYKVTLEKNFTKEPCFRVQFHLRPAPRYSFLFFATHIIHIHQVKSKTTFRFWNLLCGLEFLAEIKMWGHYHWTIWKDAFYASCLTNMGNTLPGTKKMVTKFSRRCIYIRHLLTREWLRACCALLLSIILESTCSLSFRSIKWISKQKPSAP